MYVCIYIERVKLKEDFRIYKHTHIHAYMCTYRGPTTPAYDVYMYICIRICICTCICICLCNKHHISIQRRFAYIQTYTHTYVHTGGPPDWSHSPSDWNKTACRKDGFCGFRGASRTPEQGVYIYIHTYACFVSVHIICLITHIYFFRLMVYIHYVYACI